MSLDWYVDEIKDYKTVCWIDNGETDAEGEKLYNLNPVTDALIWATMAVGMLRITEDNYEEFFTRLHMYEKGVQPFLRQWPKTDEEKLEHGRAPRPLPITLADVRQHIGLSTNASQFSQARFHKELIARMRRQAESTVRYERRKEQQKEQEGGTK